MGWPIRTRAVGDRRRSSGVSQPELIASIAVDLLERANGAANRHPWEVARLAAIARLVERTGAAGARVLDVGCGDGYVIRELQQRFGFARAVGLDVNLTQSLRASLSSPAVQLVSELDVDPANRFDLVLLLDVLEHVEAPEEFLGGVLRDRLEPGGAVVLTVPAFPALFSHHDRELRHLRRYRRTQLLRTAEGAGARVVASGYFFASLLILRAFAVFFERMGRPASGRVEEGSAGVGGWSRGAYSTRIVAAALQADAGSCLAFARVGIRIPGLSAWAICRRP